MKKSERAELIQTVLNDFFPDPTPPLQSQDLYTMLVAVLLSAQCTDARVNLTTPELFALADTPEKMARVPVEEIQEIIRPCGLSPRKSAAILGLSKILVEQHGGKVPRTFEELEALPGVGHKTASVVIAQGFHLPAFPVDTHIDRCAKRWRLSRGKNVVEVERDLKKLYPKESWNKLHLQIIYFARRFCPARGHTVSNCPICSVIG